MSCGDLESEQNDGDGLWCGVFQGGGARGAAYAGALEALHDRGQWFQAVAGSSAGAITAALVAAGFAPREIRYQTPQLLAAVRPDTLLDQVLHTLGWTHLLRYDSTALEYALDQLLHQAVDAPRDTPPICFRQLLEATGIRLYVIVGDASTGVPVPFCAETTPELSVAAAVVASCAIPVLFAPRYAVVDSTAGTGPTGPLIRRLHDGGLWANFPTFVFTDLAFRAYHGLDPDLSGPVLGFSLIHDLTPPTRFARFVDVAPRRRGVAEALSAPPDPVVHPARLRVHVLRRCLVPVICLLAAITLLHTGTDQARLLLPAGTLLIVGAATLGSLSWRLANLVMINVPIAAGGLFACYAWDLTTHPTGTDTNAASAITATLAAVLIGSGLLLHRVIERTAAGLHGALSLLTGPTIRHAPWLDQLPGSHLIYLPTGELTMLSFDATAAAVKATVEAARSSCAKQLDQILNEDPTLEPTGTPRARRADETAGIPELQHIVDDHKIFDRRRSRRRGRLQSGGQLAR